LTAKAIGAAEVVVTDINDGRLAVAKTLGADHVYKVCTFKNLVVCLNEVELWRRGMCQSFGAFIIVKRDVHMELTNSF
jgi:Zn-dependent alcohol dehydrogenase